MYAAFYKVISYVVIIIIGYWLKASGHIRKDDFHIFSFLVLKVVLPCVAVYNLGSLTMDYAYLLLIPLGLVLPVAYALLYGIFFKPMGKSIQAFSMLNGSGYSIGSFALPFMQASFDSLSVSLACIFDSGNATMCNGIIYAICDLVKNGAGKFDIKAFFRKLFSSICFDTYFVMMFVLLFKITLPAPIMTFTSIVSASSPFLCMLIIGITLDLNIQKAHIFTIAKLLGFRLILSTILALVFWFLLPAGFAVRRVLVFLMFAPQPTATLVFTDELDEDISIAGDALSVHILISIIILSILTIVLN